jgi:hypothetical protein
VATLAFLAGVAVLWPVGSGHATADRDPGLVEHPRCHAATARAPVAQRLRFRTRCNFEVLSIRIDPDGTVLGVRRRASVQHAEEDDRFRCRRSTDGEKVRCKGNAGAFATVRSRFRPDDEPCTVSTAFRFFGGPDCGGDVCPEIAYFVRERDDRPAGCA